MIMISSVNSKCPMLRLRVNFMMDLDQGMYPTSFYSLLSSILFVAPTSFSENP